MPDPRRRLAVLGSPIAHSKSPALHAAAYRELGVDWEYSAIEVSGDSLAEFVGSRDESWRGLSLTMPLKRDVIPLLAEADPIVQLTGVANTVVFERLESGTRSRGFNTDVYGIERALGDAGVGRIESVRILGGGATAASALVAAHRMGARHATIAVRSPSRSDAIVDLAGELAVPAVVTTLDAPSEPADVVISTLPNGVVADVDLPASLRASSTLLDVAYEPWPTALASAWMHAGGPVVAGIEMLVHQAVAQVRAFVSGDPATELDREPAVLEAMRAAVGLT